MPQAAISRTVEHADIPYDKFRYDMVIQSSVGVEGKLTYLVVVTVYAGRWLPSTEQPESTDTATWTRWEDDPNPERRGKTVTINDIDAFIAQNPSFGPVQGGISAALEAYNAQAQVI